MTPKFWLSILIVTSALSLTVCEDRHHHVIIHVPYKINTIHHIITKHIHHYDQKGGDKKYQVIGYTIGKPIDVGLHFHTSHEQVMANHNFKDNNELSNDNSWVPSYGQHELTSHGYGQNEDHVNTVHEFAEHISGSDYGGYN